MKKIARKLSVLALAGTFLANAVFASPQGGAPQKLPAVKTDTVFYDSFEDVEIAKQQWLIVDNNKDGRTWGFSYGTSPSSANLHYGYSSIKADDYAISQLFALKADRSYRLTYFANNLYYEEDVEFWLGTARTVEDMTLRLDSTHVPDMPNGLWRTQVFSVPADGQYCLGVRAVSKANRLPGLYIDNISVTEEMVSAAPAPVVGLVQVPGNNGTGMQLKWTNPSQNEKGETLSENLTAIEIYKNYGNTAQTYNLSLVPGTEVTWTDPNPAPGKVSYHVYAVNVAGRSYPQVVNTFVGEDMPSAPRNLQVAVNGGNVTITWDEPGEFGANGGWYNKQNLTYLVTRKPNYTVLETSVQTRTKTDAVDELGYFYYEVTARNVKGLGEKAVSQGIKAGTVMNLPYHEEFEDEESYRALWSMADLNNDRCVWDLDPARGNLKPGAAHYNWLLGRNDPYDASFNAPAANDYLFSPLMRFEKGKNYRLRYSLRGVMMSDVHLRISLGKTANSQAMNKLIENLSESTTGDYVDKSVEFTADETGSFCLGFLYTVDDGYLWIDDLWVEEIAANDLALASIAGSHTPKVGEPNTYVLTVENKGTAAARNYKVRLLDQAGNELAVSAEQTRPVAAGRTNAVSVNWTPQNTDITLLRGEVVWADDEVAKNNIGEELLVRMQGNGFKAIQVGDGEIKDYNVPWYVFNKGFGQTVYPASYMEGMVGKINALSYQVMVGFQDGKDLEDQHFRIWMGESTDRYDMSAGWFTSKELTCVFDSSVTIKNGCYDWYLPLQHAYDYKGGHLVVCIEGRNPYGYLGNFGMYFKCTESTSNATHRSLYGYQQVSMDDEVMDNLAGKFFALRPNTTFFFDVNGMGGLNGKVSDKDSKALENVLVAVNGLNVTKRTGTDGNYSFPYVPAGNNTVNFTKVGYEDLIQSVSVSEGETASLNVTMQNRPVVKVSGVIVGSDDPHKGLPLVQLTLEGPSSYQATTDENGCYTIEDVYGNLTYTAKITASGYSDYAEDFEVKAVDLKADTIVISKMVNMPSSVNAYDRKDYALVEWTDPVPVAWLQLDKGSIYGSFGGRSDQAYMVGHRYTPEVFETNGITAASAITKVRFWPDAVATFVLQIYAGEKGTESLVREEPVEIDQYGTWFEYALQRPVAIDPSKNYIVALKVQQSSGSNPVGFDRGPAVENGDLFSSDNGHTWITVASVSATMNYNWLIHTYCSANPNALPTEPAELLSVRPESGNTAFLAEYGSAQVSMPALAGAAPENTVVEGGYTFKLYSKAQRKAAASVKEVENYSTAGYTYEVYRLMNGQEQDKDAWTKITATPTADMQLRDLGWPLLQDTLWRYAVRSFSDGAYSDYTFSRAVDKGKYVDVRVEVLTNTSEKAAGALVQLKGINNTYTATVGANDSAILANIHYGTYDLTVRKEGYGIYTAQGIELDELHYDLGTVTLLEDVRPPLEFKVVDWVDYVDCSWKKPIRRQDVELTKTQSEFSSGYGANAGGDMMVGQRFVAQELQSAGVDGFYINSISFYPAVSADFTIKVWKSDNVGEEREAYSQAVSSADLVMEQWNTIVLDEPVLINAEQSYIIGYNAYMSPATYPVGADNGPVVTGGDLLFYNGAWSSFCSFAPTTYDFNWMIRATVSNTRGVTKTLAKAEEELDYTYELYRFAEANLSNPALWSKLTGNNFKELGHVDNDWKNQADGNYYYAVFSRSQTGNTSDTILSELQPKGQVSVVTVKATTNNGTSAQGALVRLSSEEKTYSDVIGADGSVAIPAVLKGSYALEIEKPHFETLKKTVSVSESKAVLDGNELKEKLDVPIVRAFKRGDANVRVDWYSPVNPGAYPHYITWSTDEFFTGIGQQSGSFSASCAHKYTPADLRERDVVGSYIYKIRFYPASQANAPTRGSYRVQVWEGEDGVAVLSQNVPSASIKYNEWNEVVLEKPYYIDGTKTILVGYSANLTQGWGCGIDHGPAVRGRGNMINVDGSWAHITDLSPDLDYNWMIQAYCTDALEAGVETNKSVKAEGEDFVKAYTVYRLREADMTVPDRWTLLKENTTDKNLQDSHADLPDAWYMYAVKAIYATGESAYAFSDRLGKGVANEALEEAGFEPLVVMPNPNKGQFSMNLPYNGKVSVYALDGSLVWQDNKTAGLCAFDLNLPSGIYTLVLTDNNRKAAGRLIIVK